MAIRFIARSATLLSCAFDERVRSANHGRGDAGHTDGEGQPRLLRPPIARSLHERSGDEWHREFERGASVTVVRGHMVSYMQ